MAVCYSSSELRGGVHPIRVISAKTVKTVWNWAAWEIKTDARGVQAQIWTDFSRYYPGYLKGALTVWGDPQNRPVRDSDFTHFFDDGQEKKSEA